MMRTLLLHLTLAAAVFSASPAAWAQDHDHGSGPIATLDGGTGESCTADIGVATGPLSSHTAASTLIGGAASPTPPLSGPAAASLPISGPTMPTRPLAGSDAATPALSSVSMATNPITAYGVRTWTLSGIDMRTMPFAGMSESTPALSSMGVISGSDCVVALRHAHKCLSARTWPPGPFPARLPPPARSPVMPRAHHCPWRVRTPRLPHSRASDMTTGPIAGSAVPIWRLSGATGHTAAISGINSESCGHGMARESPPPLRERVVPGAGPGEGVANRRFTNLDFIDFESTLWFYETVDIFRTPRLTRSRRAGTTLTRRERGQLPSAKPNAIYFFRSPHVSSARTTRRSPNAVGPLANRSVLLLTSATPAISKWHQGNSGSLVLPSGSMK